METAEIIAVSAVVLLIGLELLCLFLCSKLKCRSYPLWVIVPIHTMDSELSQRLDYIGAMIEDGSTLIGNILLMNMNADEKQLRLCREFCSRYHAAEIILPEDIGRSVKNYLHFQSNYDII